MKIVPTLLLVISILDAPMVPARYYEMWWLRGNRYPVCGNGAWACSQLYLRNTHHKTNCWSWALKNIAWNGSATAKRFWKRYSSSSGTIDPLRLHTIIAIDHCKATKNFGQNSTRYSSHCEIMYACCMMQLGCTILPTIFYSISNCIQRWAY